MNVPADNLNSSFETGVISEYQSSGNVDLIQLALEDCEIDLQAEDSEADTVCDPDICALTEGISKAALTTDVARTDMPYHCCGVAMLLNEMRSWHMQ
jgi:hypothetical protein